MFDEELPQKRSPEPVRRDLSSMSVDEMKEYIEELEAESARVKAELHVRSDVRSAAEALFKPQGS